MGRNFRQLTKQINVHNQIRNARIMVREVEGYHSDTDKIIQLNTEGQWANVTVPTLLDILRRFMENQDKQYPISQGMKGRQMIVEAINMLAEGKTVGEVLEVYGDKHKDI